MELRREYRIVAEPALGQGSDDTVGGLAFEPDVDAVRPAAEMRASCGPGMVIGAAQAHDPDVRLLVVREPPGTVRAVLDRRRSRAMPTLKIASQQLCKLVIEMSASIRIRQPEPRHVLQTPPHQTREKQAGRFGEFGAGDQSIGDEVAMPSLTSEAGSCDVDGLFAQEPIPARWAVPTAQVRTRGHRHTL